MSVVLCNVVVRFCCSLALFSRPLLSFCDNCLSVCKLKVVVLFWLILFSLVGSATGGVSGVAGAKGATGTGGGNGCAGSEDKQYDCGCSGAGGVGATGGTTGQ